MSACSLEHNRGNSVECREFLVDSLLSGSLQQGPSTEKGTVRTNAGYLAVSHIEKTGIWACKTSKVKSSKLDVRYELNIRIKAEAHFFKDWDT